MPVLTANHFGHENETMIHTNRYVNTPFRAFVSGPRMEGPFFVHMVTNKTRAMTTLAAYDFRV